MSLGEEEIVSAMSWLKQKKGPVDLEEFKDIDEDALVEALSPEEIAELNAAIDPEVRLVKLLRLSSFVNDLTADQSRA